MDRLRERVGNVLRARRLVAPLDVRLRHLDRVAVGEVRVHRHERARLLPGRDEQRRLVCLRVEQRADAVADARRGVEVDVGDGAARLRVAVGHADRDRLLEPEHVAEILREGAPASAARSIPGCRRSSSSRARGRDRSWLHERSSSAALPCQSRSLRRSSHARNVRGFLRGVRGGASRRSTTRERGAAHGGRSGGRRRMLSMSSNPWPAPKTQGSNGPPVPAPRRPKPRR